MPGDLVFSPTGDLLALSGPELTVRDAVSGEVLVRLDNPAPQGRDIFLAGRQSADGIEPATVWCIYTVSNKQDMQSVERFLCPVCYMVKLLQCSKVAWFCGSLHVHIIKIVFIILNTVRILMGQRQGFNQRFDQAVGIIDAFFCQEAIADNVVEFEQGCQVAQAARQMVEIIHSQVIEST